MTDQCRWGHQLHAISAHFHRVLALKAGVPASGAQLTAAPLALAVLRAVLWSGASSSAPPGVQRHRCTSCARGATAVPHLRGPGQQPAGRWWWCPARRRRLLHACLAAPPSRHVCALACGSAPAWGGARHPSCTCARLSPVRSPPWLAATGAVQMAFLSFGYVFNAGHVRMCQYVVAQGGGGNTP
jgi:hypothetical protein